MSYCRWSCLNGQCDAYVYEGDGGFVTHIAKSRPPEGGPEKGLKIFLDRGLEAYTRATAIYDEWFARNPAVKIDHPEAGASFGHECANECADNLERLRGEGFIIPDYAIEQLREDAAPLPTGGKTP